MRISAAGPRRKTLISPMAEFSTRSISPENEFLRMEQNMKRILSLLVAAGLLASTAAQADITLLNVSYDPTRELYKDLGAAFAASYKADKVTVNTSNGGSGAQARAVID